MNLCKILPLFGALLMIGCGAHEKYAYLSDAPRNEEMTISTNYQSLIYPGDQLYIYVNSIDETSVRVFNEETNSLSHDPRHKRGYLVSNQGEIVFPVLGKVHVAGLTRDALAHEIEARLIEQRYVADPVVSVSLMNFRVAVVGEVKQPMELTAIGDRLTIFEALAQCGDITMYGLRDCVTIIRSSGDVVVVDTIDLTSREVLDSPYYYLQQNDVVYVQPTARRRKEAYRNEDWPKYVATSVGFLHTAYLLIYRFIIRTDLMHP